MTELADTLVREQGLPFKTAHSIAGLLLKARALDPGAPLGEALKRASQALVGRAIEYSDERLDEIMSARYFVTVRRTLGGPAPEETTRALADQRQLLERDRNEWLARRDHLTKAEQLLRMRVKAL
jgi:argininosuccinate lyase